METMIEYVKTELNGEYEVAIDFTMGYGNDTLTLSKTAKKFIVLIFR